MSFTERRRRFPLEVRAIRTPSAPAILWRMDDSPTALAPFECGDAVRSGSPAPLRSLSYAELDRWTRAAARALLRSGVAPGERVALLLPPGPALPALLLGLLRAGCVAAPLSTRVPTTALPDMLSRIGCRRLIAIPGPATRALGGSEVISAPDLLAAVSGEGFGDAPGRPPLRGAAGPVLPPFDRRADATLVFSSGSTGPPKAALHSFENHWASAVGANRCLGLRSGDIWLLSLPLWHVGGLAIVFRCLQAGAAVAVASANLPLADAAAELGATHLSLVATQLYRLLRDPRGREVLRAAKLVLLGGGPAPVPLIAEAVGSGARLVTSYGCTELTSAATATRAGGPIGLLHSAGRPLPFRELAVAADGEILARGRTLFRGYVEGDAVDTARDADGWYHTGDLGQFGADGRLAVAGRRDAMFISGGENIHPEEIERRILLFPGIEEAIVVPLADREFGARPAAFLRTADGTLPDAVALGVFLRRTLPGFMVPVRYLPWPDLAQGLKPDRRALSAMAAPAAS